MIASLTRALLLAAAFTTTASAATLPYSESFDGPDFAPWPSPWTTQSFYITVHDLQSNRGRMSGQAANGSASVVCRMLLPGFLETDVEATMSLEFENVAQQGIGFYVRQNGGTLREYAPHGQGYAMFLKGSWGWPEDLGLWREIDGVETQFAPGYAPVPGGFQNGVRYRTRLRVTQHAPDSTRIQARVWPEAEPEPAAWTVEAYDSHPALQGVAGSFALDIYNFQGTAHVFVDDLLILPYPPQVSASGSRTPPRLSMSIPWPHPVPEAARIQCSLPEPANARLEVFDLAGRRVASVFEGSLQAGPTTLSWVPVDPAGRRLATGVYQLRLEAAGLRTARRILVTR